MTTLKCSILLFFYLTCSLGYSAEKKLVLLGGGGEPSGPTTIFDGQLGLLSGFTGHKANNWDASISFNGGHEKTEALLRSKFKNARSIDDFTDTGFQKSIEDLKNQIESGSLKSGDQLMLLLTTHGAQKKADEKTHSIALSRSTATDLKTLQGSDTVSIDKLDELVALADEKGIKLGIIDLSCFSGATLALARPSTCIISATGDKNYGYAEIRKPDDKSPAHTFSAKFLQQMKPGTNLEDIFLKARNGNATPDFPMISTDTGIMVNELIYNFIHPYLNYNSVHDHDFSDIYKNKSKDEAVCLTDFRYSEIIRRIDEISKMTEIPAKMLNTAKLKKALEAYRNYQLKYEKDWMETRLVADEVKEILKRDYPDHVKHFKYEDGLAILQIDYDRSLKMYKESLDAAKDDWSKKFYQGIYDTILLKQKISQELSQKISKQSRKKIEKFDKTFAESGITRNLAYDVSSEAKKLYDQIYKAKRGKNKNPCKDFIL